jgi:hypothetical protein
VGYQVAKKSLPQGNLESKLQFLRGSYVCRLGRKLSYYLRVYVYCVIHRCTTVEPLMSRLTGSYTIADGQYNTPQKQGADLLGYSTTKKNIRNIRPFGAA